MLKKVFRYIAIHDKLFILLALAIAVVFPFLTTNPYVMRMGIVSLMYVMLALSLNLLMGTMGQVSFGHSAFWGIGAYTVAILTTRLGMSSVLSWILAAVMAGLFGLVLGLPVLKLRGYYLTIVTLGFCEIIRLVELNWMDLTRGPLGITAIPKPSIFGFQAKSPQQLYFLMLILVVLTTYIVKALIDSRIGTTLLAIRDDDLAAEAMGVNVFKYKVMTFVISAMLAGLAGAFYAQYINYVDPSSFTVDQSQQIAIMVIFGGLGSVVGSFLGAITLQLIPEFLRGLDQYRMLLYGVLLVVMMLVKPDGLLGSVNFKYLKQQDRFEKAGGTKHQKTALKVEGNQEEAK